MGKMTNCKACGKEIAKGVNKCVHCGKDQRNFFMKHKIITVILALVILGSIGAMTGKKDEANKAVGTTSTSSKPAATETKKEEPKKDNKKYSFDKFMQVQMGMTYDQVKAILGDGTEESSSSIGDIKTVAYSWKNSDGSNISVMLQGDKVSTKAQAFLQKMDAKVTMDKYNKINNGMTYDQVKEILGEGQLMSQTQIMDTKGEMYSWINSGGSNMNVTFQNGEVNMKAQFQLK